MAMSTVITAKSRKTTGVAMFKQDKKVRAMSSSKSGSKPGKGKAVKRVYFFGPGKTEGGAGQKELLGGKGANLADMTSAKLPVPPGFTTPPEPCREYNEAGGKLPAGLMDEVKKNLKLVEKKTGK